MSEALPGGDEGAGGLLHLMRFVACCLCVLHLGDLHILPHLIKLLLRLFKLPNIPAYWHTCRNIAWKDACITEGRKRVKNRNKFGIKNKGLTPSQNYATAALRISGPDRTGSVKDTKGKQLYLCRTEEYGASKMVFCIKQGAVERGETCHRCFLIGKVRYSAAVLNPGLETSF